MARRQLVQTIKFFFLLLVAGGSAGAAEVELRPTCICNYPYVTLADVAELRNCDPQLEEQLRKVRLLPSPASGRIRVLRVREIQELLALHGVDVSAIEFRGTSRVQLRGSLTSDVNVQPSNESSSRSVVVSRRALTRGEIIRADDIELKQVYSPVSERESLIENMDEVIGQQTTRSITAGQMMNASMLRRPIVVHRSGNVTVYVRVGGIQVATKARSLGDGALDDVVTVELLDDRTKRLAGRVIGLDEVEVFAQGAAVDPVQMRELPVTKTIDPPAKPEVVPQITRKNERRSKTE